MNSISVVISAWNEESKIIKCLESVQWADEIVLVDNESSDQTVKLGKKYKAKIFTRPNNSMLNLNKNFGFSKATCDWIISLDADEVIPESLANEIRHSIADNDGVVGFWIPRKNIIFGKWIQHGLWWPDKQLRLFRRNRGKFACKHVHEYLVVEGRTSDLHQPFIHYNYESISQYLRKMDTIYTQNEVNKLLLLKYQLNWHDAIKFPVSDFLKIYFAQEGYKDGIHGLVLASLQSFYSFIIFAKLWEKNNFTNIDISLPSIDSDLKKSIHEYTYWFNSAMLNGVKNIFMKSWYRIRRKLYS